MKELNALVGKDIIMTDCGYMSFTPVMGEGFTLYDPVVLVMKVPEGNHAAFVDPISTHSGEMEVILPRNTRGVISGTEQIGGKTFVYLDILPEFSGSEKEFSRIIDENLKATNISKSGSSALSSVAVSASIPQFTSMLDIHKFILDELSPTALSGLSLEESLEKSQVFKEALNNYFGKKASLFSLQTPYEELISISNFTNIDTDIKNDAIAYVIANNKSLRNDIMKNASSEIANNLANTFGISDPNIVKKITESLLGTDFVEQGIGKGYNWDEYIETIKPYVIENMKKKSSIAPPILWGKVNESLLNSTFGNTVENMTGGEFPFMNAVYSNWDSTTSEIPMLQEYWKKLSDLYVESCGEALGKGSTIKFIYGGYNPVDGGINKGFGEIFKTTELSRILSDGKIDYIELHTVNPSNLEQISTKVISLIDLREYAKTTYFDKGLEIDDYVINDIFEKFLKKVEE